MPRRSAGLVAQWRGHAFGSSVLGTDSRFRQGSVASGAIGWGRHLDARRLGAALCERAFALRRGSARCARRVPASPGNQSNDSSGVSQRIRLDSMSDSGERARMYRLHSCRVARRVTVHRKSPRDGCRRLATRDNMEIGCVASRVRRFTQGASRCSSGPNDFTTLAAISDLD